MRRWIIVTSFACILAACAPAYDGALDPTTTTTTVGSAPAELAAARARWAFFGTTDYTYVFTNDCGECGPASRAPQRVAVLAGQVLAVEAGDKLTVEEVFERIEQALDNGRRVEVSYDPDSGLPRDVQIDMDMRPVDGGTHWMLGLVWCLGLYWPDFIG